MKKNSFLIIFSLFTISMFSQTIYYVKTDGNDNSDGLSWNNAFATISKAISSAVKDDEIRVGQGTFNSTATYTITVSLTIKGGYGADGNQDYAHKTVLDGKNAFRIMRAYWLTYGHVPDIKIDGFVFKNAYSVGYSGALVFDKNIGTVSNCEFTNNVSPSYGGGGFALVNTSEKTVIVNCAFHGNSGKEGGAIYCGTGTTLDVINSTIAKNSCGSGTGGGIFCNGTVNLKNSILWDNKKGTDSDQLNGNGTFILDHNIIQGEFQDETSIPDSIISRNLQSHMVIQQQSDFTIKGKTIENQPVYVYCSWDEATTSYTTTASADGKWSITIQTPEASFDKRTIMVETNETYIFSDILIGEVWVGSGQSNMVFMMKDVLNAEAEVNDADLYPEIRLLNMARVRSDSKIETINQQWQACSKTTIPNFSAVAYLFGRKLFRELNVPIGLINSSWGDTTAEVWVERDSVLGSSDPEVITEATRNDNTPRVTPATAYKIGSAYNAMIYPLRDIPVAGAIWYQGESNSGRPYYYPALLNILVKNWRHLWNRTEDEFPFYIAQICPYTRKFNYPTYYANPTMRFMQANAATLIPNSGIESNDDIADLNDIHPKNKQDVGLRLAWLALSKHYGKDAFKDNVTALYKSHTIDNNQVTVTFDYVGNGLKTRDSEAPTMFEIAGVDKVFYPASATISGTDQVILTSANVPVPVAVRLGWSYTKITNLVNSEDLPVSVFKTYNWLDSSEEIASSAGAPSGPQTIISVTDNVNSVAETITYINNKQTDAKNQSPLFLDLENGNFQLSTNSPAIDSGKNDLFPTTMLTDLNNQQRIFNSIIDLGCYEFVQSTGINKTMADDIQVYPNPASGYLMIKSKSPLQRIQLTDLTGKIVYQQSVSNGVELISIDITNLSKGIYLLRADDKTSSIIIR